MEGHRDVVVHGPLNLISILDLWRDIQGKKGSVEDSSILAPQSISYRATSPLYAGDEYRVVLQEGEMGVSHVQIMGPGDVMAMKAEIRS